MLRQAPTCAPTAVQRSVGGLRSRVCRPSLVPGQRSSRMLSETLANLSITSSSGAYHRRPGVPARVAQLPTFTGSDDSQGLPDIELGQQQQHGGPEPVQPPPHQQQQQHGAAVGASAAAAHNKDGERLADTVTAEVQRKRFEALFTTSSSHHLPGLPGDSSSSSSSQGRRQQQQRSASSRELSSPADDETLPMLAEDAAHPVLQQQHRQQQLPPGGDAGSSGSSSHHHQHTAATPLQPAAARAAAAAAAAADAAAGPAMIGGGIPRSIFVLSMVSMALTSASCVFNTLLPIYMVTELKMTMRTMGMFEGMLEAFSYVVRMFSGVISDKMTSRKAAITAGFAMGAAAKFGMSGATTTLSLFVTKAIDRLGNGVQAAPRDALIGDLSPAASRSACFGFAQSMRKWGSFMGAGLAFALMKASDNNYRAIFLLAAGVSALSTVAFAFFVPSHPNASSSSHKAGVPRSPTPEQQPLLAQQPKQAQLRLRQQQQQPAGAASEQQPSPSLPSQQPQQPPPLWDSVAQFARDVRSMGVDFYRTLSVIALYGLGHINESLLEARAIEVGFGKAESTLVVALLCFSVFLCAYPLGRLDDEHGHATTFGLGMAALVAGDLVLLTSSAWPPAVFVACAFWGVHWAVVQGPMLSAVVGLAPPHLKGTAFGIFYTMMAVVAVGANTMFGSVWHAHGATAAFGLSAAIIGVTMLLTPLLLPAAAKVGRKAAAAAAAAAPGGSDGGSSGGMALKPAAA